MTKLEIAFFHSSNCIIYSTLYKCFSVCESFELLQLVAMNLFIIDIITAEQLVLTERLTYYIDIQKKATFNYEKKPSSNLMTQ